MSAHADPTAELTANDRWKQGWEQVFWKSMIIAIVAHFAVFQFWPSMVAADIAPAEQTLTQMIPPPDTELPKPPEQIQRPATPEIAQAEVPDDRTIGDTNFESNPPELTLRPPPSTRADSIPASGFTAFEVAPLLTNQRQVEQALAREYPNALRDAGIGGTVLVTFSIDEEGTILSRAIGTSSGYPRLDEAALRVADIMTFSPAMNRDVAVPVRITMPVHFRVREPVPLPRAIMG